MAIAAAMAFGLPRIFSPAGSNGGSTLMRAGAAVAEDLDLEQALALVLGECAGT